MPEEQLSKSEFIKYIEQLSKSESIKYMEQYRNRLIDQKTLVWWKSMDLWTNRLLKDCELYITLFWLLIAWMTFIYNQLFWYECINTILKITFFINFILITVGIIFAFKLRGQLSKSIENYYDWNTIILWEEILNLKWITQDSEGIERVLFLVENRRNKLDELLYKYKIREEWFLIKKDIIYAIYRISLIIFLAILWIILFM